MCFDFCQINEWNDVSTRPPVPSEKEVERRWYWSKGFRGYHHYEKSGAKRDYESDNDTGYDDYCDDDLIADGFY